MGAVAGDAEGYGLGPVQRIGLLDGRPEGAVVVPVIAGTVAGIGVPNAATVANFAVITLDGAIDDC